MLYNACRAEDKIDFGSAGTPLPTSWTFPLGYTNWVCAVTESETILVPRASQGAGFCLVCVLKGQRNGPPAEIVRHPLAIWGGIMV